ncbi:UDP-glycosyltransferase UGT5 [Anthophora retusa]
MIHLKILFYLILALSIDANYAYRILCLFPFNGRSHFKMFGALCEGLAERGHQIDMISHFPIKKSIANYRDIVDLNGTREPIVNSLTIEQAQTVQHAITYYLATKYGGDLCELLGHEKIQNFVKNPPNDPPYDLIVTEYLGSPCYLGIGQLLNAPIAIVTSFLEQPYIDDFMGNPFNFAFFPGACTHSAVLNTFADRLWNFLTNYKEMVMFYHYTSDQTEIMRKYLGTHLPDIRELERNVCLALVNSHYSFHGIRSFTPAVVEVGGLHIENDESKLTPELNDWLESAHHGLVYFTLGSLMNIETLPEKTLLDLYASFAKISPVKVLMRCTDTTKLPPGLPNNVITSPWIPQTAVLRHRNTRVFITHGGLMGSQETMYYGVPVIGIPVFSDQMRNINIIVHKNMGVLLRLRDISEHSMDAALNAVLHDPKYRESARKMSLMFRNRPISALDTAIYWIEHVIRNGPDSLKSPTVNMSWWKLNLIDVFAFLITCVVLVAYCLLSLIRVTLRKFFRSNTAPKKKSN